ncbi:MAG: peptide-methionine (R)-S-oxide reductase MsrB [Flavobacteriaceae bacterium]|nr:peptide-methionine (R)-S-oxide reductase MsrB [Flavobacteriaceae bacterium]MCY4216843.1 peptide-methionine (R)-S-oxide reductase MsrB [Flavobacteriaceae bacterium]MCY4253403.1 peptide-methionine (R)-S-oxide reductase MsrB [Flavobacteriaceae bacterium]
MSDFPKAKSKKDWVKILSKWEYQILIEKGTEPPFSGKYNNFKSPGKYTCKGCGQNLFDSLHKFDSGCGWPSFDQSIKNSVVYQKDTSFGIHRIEIICSQCGVHLGHVFDDGPTQTKKRYCVNSASLVHKN